MYCRINHSRQYKAVFFIVLHLKKKCLYSAYFGFGLIIQEKKKNHYLCQIQSDVIHAKLLAVVCFSLS